MRGLGRTGVRCSGRKTERMALTFEEQEHAILDRMLLNVAQKRALLGPSEMELATFAASKGVAYDGELMVMGRAPNRWVSGCQADWVVDAARKKIVDDTIDVGRSEDSMLCVTEPCKSAFWRVIRAVVRDLAIADVEDPKWPSCLVWTNLYKLSPEKGGNPSARLRRMQSAECLQLLELEIAEWKPKRVLILAGRNWAKCLLDRLNVTETACTSGKFVDFVGDLVLDEGKRGVRIVVAKHPQTKPEAPLVQEVVAAFRS